MQRLIVLGSTGSIGRQTLDVVREFPNEFQVVGLSGGYNTDLLCKQVEEFRPDYLYCAASHSNLQTTGVDFLSMEEMVCQPNVDSVMVATAGQAGLGPTLKALTSRKSVALANKEAIVMAGELITRTAQENDTAILPVDSEPSAIWQCLQGETDVHRVIITASGGAFRGVPQKDLHNVTPKQALKHPTWNMGDKITIDSATLMNKGFEIIETHWMFKLPWENIDVLVHPQSIVHSMVEFTDGSIKAQLGSPDMRLPIQYALSYPKRLPNTSISKLNTSLLATLNFESLNPDLYPCFSIAVQAGKVGGTCPAVLSAADEIAVSKFLDGSIKFTKIPLLVDKILSEHQNTVDPSLEDILNAAKWGRQRALEIAKVI